MALRSTRESAVDGLLDQSSVGDGDYGSNRNSRVWSGVDDPGLPSYSAPDRMASVLHQLEEYNLTEAEQLRVRVLKAEKDLVSRPLKCPASIGFTGETNFLCRVLPLVFWGSTG